MWYSGIPIGTDTLKEGYRSSIQLAVFFGLSGAARNNDVQDVAHSIYGDSHLSYSGSA